MSSKVSQICEGIIEAGWLAALLVTPMFFNVYSSRIFEPDKTAYVRTIALIIFAAWLVKTVDSWKEIRPQLVNNPFERFLKFPLALLIAGLLATYLLATIFSLAPSISMWGSYQRSQGVYTALAYLIIFLSILSNLRRQKQIDRLIDVAIVASLPVALYGVLQRYKLDPIPWGGDVSVRITSSMGNSIFIAAFLIMLMPLIILKIIQVFQAINARKSNLSILILQQSLYLFIAIFNLIAIYLSGSRGPMLGLIASLFLLVLLLAYLLKRRSIAVIAAVAAILVAGFLLVFNLEQSPLESLKTSPVIGRFGQITNADSNSALVRKYIWEGVVEMVVPQPPLEYPDGKLDRFYWLRPIIGYGPETMAIAYNKYYTPELGRVERRNASPDRSHNETWDAWVNGGILGATIYLALFLAIFAHGYTWLGMIPTLRWKTLFWGLLIGGMFLVGGVVSLWRGVAYLGLGIPSGLIAGLMTYTGIISLVQPGQGQNAVRSQVSQLLIAVILVAIAAHFIETNLGIAIASTRLYFWILLGVMVVLGYFQLDKEWRVSVADGGQTPAPNINATPNQKIAMKGKSRKNPAAKRTSSVPEKIFTAIHPGILPGVLSALLLVTLGFDFITVNTETKTISEILTLSLFKKEAAGILLLITLTWIVSVIVLYDPSSEAASSEMKVKHLYAILAGLGLSLLVGVIFFTYQAHSLSVISRAVIDSLDGVLLQVIRYENIVVAFLIMQILLLGTLATLLVSERCAGEAVESRAQHRWTSTPTWNNLFTPIAVVLVAVLVVWMIGSLNVRGIKADVAFKLGDSFARPGTWGVATQIYKRAVELAPKQDYYYLYLAKAYLEGAKSIQDEAEKQRLMEASIEDIQYAQGINPLNTDHTANLARIYSMWASGTQDERVRVELSTMAEGYFGKAIILSPNNARIWDEWALHDLNVNNNLSLAYEKLQHSLAIDPSYDWTYGLLGDHAARIARSSNDTVEKERYLREAAALYQQALDYIKYYEAQNRYSYLIALANVFVELGELKAALETYLQADLYTPGNVNPWKVEELRGRLYYSLTNTTAALEHLQRAFELAPEDAKAGIQQQIERINAMP
jgi:tetratricopeptide (TPR) repeat protein/O-antigen ligase